MDYAAPKRKLGRRTPIVHQEKVDTSALGHMPKTTSVKLSLVALLGYLILMMLLALYQG